MHVLIIPLLIIALLVGIYESGDIFKNLNLSLPAMGKDGLNIRQFLGAPAGPDSPLRNLSD
ncbi:MAG: hypothetical protein A3J30_00330 [Candidatus Wildermuthbacteria bacterium RIFCSPLOWO2_02_FULL_47_9c]|uniref:Uncharacterized protein n=2 Tax=Parcubacteria group TaxID=1794811 RepID=A0A837ISA1_9BACT|nr:MAG: hypothetical protein UY25_C0004G0057 [Candidatus Yanofskybacteria bacterium GW2011_GWC1_48_11]KKW04507.1 MAG: hypothetical protein UY38_C0001G0074 [Parcubacteria group bacterium GW2011_GWB1_49_12]KKW09235.1 MAG: hypothetical protein UY45_C0001G0121 [Parcubacteria group bacterium GW2011_GWA1_49_26]KKW14126.1 MAG: hypothetical protein UY53_C0003G0046 [Parcubacteria group bacterium GW2011_GWA2_50_10]OHA61486.1 MAG: hypothetical protein A2109_01235 [Candidatus Wildermuthbacteria bacterium G